jgi:phosphotransferase family enzyme
MSSSKLPNLKALTTGLITVFRSNGLARESVTILGRRPNRYESTFPSEIVTCRLDSKKTALRLFCKYGTGKFDPAYGHRGDVSYEGQVYSKVLGPLHTSTAIFYGLYADKVSARPWLIIEYLEGASRDISKSTPAVIHAARWIGKFHAANENTLRTNRLNFLRRYDDKYYIGWARRTSRLFSNHKARLPWLQNVCTGFQGLVPHLLRGPKTIIHGEYYPTNVIYQNGLSRPADWQSTAVAVGEIDLAALTQNWPREIAERLQGEYRMARWPRGEHDHFDRLLGVAKLYMALRWLGDPSLLSPSLRRLVVSDRSERLSAQSMNLVRKHKKFIDELCSQGESLGLI